MTTNDGSHSTASLLLSDLFSHANFELSVPPYKPPSQAWTSVASSSRDVAFYDEVLQVKIQLTLPSLPAHLPPPQPGHAVYPLPLSLDPSDDADISEHSEQARATRLVLLALLSCLAVDIRGTYTTPREPLPPGVRPVPPTIAATPLTSAAGSVVVPHNQRPTPSICHLRDAPYQDQKSNAYADDVTFFSTAWPANQSPPPRDKNRTSASPANGIDDANGERPTSCFVEWNQKEQIWGAQWQVEVPVIYARHRHPNPALILTAGLSLRLMPSASILTALTSNLTGGSPYLSLAGPNTPSSWADHDLLASLSAGPVYPDESPSQRAARAASALAKLPLSRLPSKVLATKLVTPERSARDVGRKLTSNKAIALPSMMGDEDGEEERGESDLGSFSSNGSSSSSPRNSVRSSTVGLNNTSSSSSGYSTPASSTMGGEADPAILRRSRDLSEDGLAVGSGRRRTTSDAQDADAVVTLQRSVLAAMDVRSAIGVRMRTTMLGHVNIGSEKPRRALALCVEVDNPSDSGVIFDVAKVSLNISVPGKASTDANDQPPLKAEAKLVGDTNPEHSATKFRLDQGEQKNLVYYVRFVADPLASSVPTSLQSQGSRNVAINVLGRPLRLAEQGDSDQAQDEEERFLTTEFSSTWNCTLDLSPLQEDLERLIFSEQKRPVNVSTTVHQGSARGSNNIGGSLKHAASSLASAAAQDWQREQERSLLNQNQRARPGTMERSTSGLSLPSALIPGRFLPSPVRTSSLAASQSGAEVESPRSMSAAGGSSMTPRSASIASPSSGSGLLAQAKLRAASARIASQTSQGFHHFGTDSNSRSATPTGATIPELWPRASARRSMSVASNGSTATAGGRVTSSGAPSVYDELDVRFSDSPSKVAIPPLRAVDDHSRVSSAWNSGGYLITTKVKCRLDGSQTQSQTSSDSPAAAAAGLPAVPTASDMSHFHLEVTLTNRSTLTRSFVISWAGQQNPVVSASHPQRSSLPSPSMARNFSSAEQGAGVEVGAGAGTGAGPGRAPPVAPPSLLDPTRALQEHLRIASSSSSSSRPSSACISALENHVKLGPVEAGQSRTCLLPLQVLLGSGDPSAQGEDKKEKTTNGEVVTLQLGDVLVRETAVATGSQYASWDDDHHRQVGSSAGLVGDCVRVLKGCGSISVSI